jgi:thioredoxin reductase
MNHRRQFLKEAGMVVGGIIFSKWKPGRLKNETMNQKKEFDVIIVGGSYAGLAAGMALGRAMRNILIIDSGNPCNQQTPHSHNFLTNDGKTPEEIASIARHQVSQYPTVQFLNGWVTTGSKTSNGFVISTETGAEFRARKLVFATGIRDIKPDIPGFAASWGISVLHCPYCHGYEVRHQPTGLLANGDAAFDMAFLLRNWTNVLTLYTNGEASLGDDQKLKLAKYGIELVEDAIEELEHDEGKLQRIIFKEGRMTALNVLYAPLPFQQHSDLPVRLGCAMTKEGYIEINPMHMTTVEGVYACGDNVTRMRTVANAVAMGTITGMMVNRDLVDEDFRD